MKVVEEFLNAINVSIDYWEKQNDLSSKEKMKGLAFSILNMLDGTSGSFEGNIKKLEKASKSIMLHESFLKKKND